MRVVRARARGTRRNAAALRLAHPIPERRSLRTGTPAVAPVIPSVSEILRSRRPITLPVEHRPNGEVMDFNKPGWCSAYAVRAAKILFGVNYERGHAWDIGSKNKTIKATAQRLKNLEPGQLVGVYFEWSNNNRPERPYTHIALCIGNRAGTKYIMHNIGRWGLRVEPLGNISKSYNGKVIEIIQPIPPVKSGD